MAKPTGPFDLTGPPKGLSAYTRHDLPGTIILRTLRAQPCQDDHTQPSTRRNSSEFGGRSTAAK